MGNEVTRTPDCENDQPTASQDLSAFGGFIMPLVLRSVDTTQSSR